MWQITKTASNITGTGAYEIPHAGRSEAGRNYGKNFLRFAMKLGLEGYSDEALWQ